MKPAMNSITEKGQTVYKKINRWSNGSLDVLKNAGQNFGDEKASQAAAGMAYYTLFSLFPFLIIMVTIASFFVKGTQAVAQITNVMETVIPVSQNLVESNLERILEIRNSVGALGLVGFLWSASNAFFMLVHNVNQAWRDIEPRSFIKKRIVAFVMIVIVLGLLILLMLSSSILELLAQIQIPLLGTIPFLDSRIYAWITNLSPWLFSFLFFLSLYRWIPSADVSWKAAGWSAALAAPLWRLASRGFSWYLRSGFPSYDLIYGSLSAIVVLLLWIYLSNIIVLLGAHICAAITEQSG